MEEAQVQKTQINHSQHQVHQVQSTIVVQINRDQISILQEAEVAAAHHHYCNQIQLVVNDLSKYFLTVPMNLFMQLEMIDDNIHLSLKMDEIANNKFIKIIFVDKFNLFFNFLSINSLTTVLTLYFI